MALRSRPVHVHPEAGAGRLVLVCLLSLLHLRARTPAALRASREQAGALLGAVPLPPLHRLHPLPPLSCGHPWPGALQRGRDPPLLPQVAPRHHGGELHVPGDVAAAAARGGWDDAAAGDARRRDAGCHVLARSERFLQRSRRYTVQRERRGLRAARRDTPVCLHQSGPQLHHVQLQRGRQVEVPEGRGQRADGAAAGPDTHAGQGGHGTGRLDGPRVRGEGAAREARTRGPPRTLDRRRGGGRRCGPAPRVQGRSLQLSVVRKPLGSGGRNRAGVPRHQPRIEKSNVSQAHHARPVHSLGVELRLGSSVAQGPRLQVGRVQRAGPHHPLQPLSPRLSQEDRDGHGGRAEPQGGGAHRHSPDR
mmetsp:Transcript_24982/g.59615  ORF Transcript_24982/g.59615 Transcript_24982/m.59615 type:complete len:363 (-) Transcript_24982:521-1609(-)